MLNRTEEARLNRTYKNKGNEAVLSEIKGTSLDILDIGCGAGDNVTILLHKGQIGSADGITLSEEEAKICSAFMRDVLVYNVELGLPETLKGPYDYVICSHVIEHIAYPERFLTGIKKVLKKDGKLIVALPNVMHYKSRIQLMLGNFDYNETGIWDHTHLRWYTFKSGVRLLQENGYEIRKKYVDGDIPFLTLFKFIPAKTRRVIFGLLCRISKGFFGGQLIYVVSPAN